MGEMILILANQSVFVTLSVVTIPPLAQGIFILTLNHADVIGDHQMRCDTKCLVSLRALCCHLWRDIKINTNRGRVLGKVSCTKTLPLGE